METYKLNARAAGVLFIIATVAGVLAVSLTGSMLAAPDYLAKLSSNANQFTVGALLVFTMGIASPAISIALYPVLRRYSESLALGSVAFRVMEGVLDAIAALLMLSLLTLSQAFAKAATGDLAPFQVLGSSLLAIDNWVNQVGALTCWTVGAFIYYYIFFRTKLIPQWLSIWGIAGLVLTTIGIVLYAFGVLGPMDPTQVALNVPILVQEMMFAVWMIVKGFDQSVLASWSGKKAHGQGLN